MIFNIDTVFVTNALTLASIVGVANYLRSIRNELRKLNGRLIKIEEWSIMHDKADEAAHGALRREIEWRTGTGQP